MVPSSSEPTSLSLIALKPSKGAEGAPEGLDYRSAGISSAIKSVFFGKKEVPLSTILKELDRVQLELDQVLARLDQKDRHGFKLSEVVVSLGLSAEGSIGVVTAGVEAGISLTFARPA